MEGEVGGGTGAGAHAIRFNESGRFLALAAGHRLAVLDLRAGALLGQGGGEGHARGEIVRDLVWVGEDAVVTVSDDKFLKLWRIQDNAVSCTATSLKNSKKLTAVTFARDSGLVIFSDKFGEAWSLPLSGLGQKPQLLLGHVSIITDVELSPSGNLLFTADRDEKVRVSKFPKAYDIQSFCLGHTEFVSSVVVPSNRPSLLISGSGDRTIRLWNPETGELLHTEQPSVARSAVTVPKSYHAATSVFAVLLEGEGRALLYEVGDNTLRELTAVTLPSHGLDADFDKLGNLWIACADGTIHVFSQDEKAYSPLPADSPLASVLAKLNGQRLLPESEFSREQILAALALRQLRKRSEKEDGEESKRRRKTAGQGTSQKPKKKKKRAARAKKEAAGAETKEEEGEAVQEES